MSAIATQGIAGIQITKTERGCGWSMEVTWDIDVTLASSRNTLRLYSELSTRNLFIILQRLGLTRDEEKALFRDKAVTGSW
jgi:hypothetical protein